MANGQRGIIADDGRFGLFLTLTVPNPRRNGRAVASACGGFPALVRAVGRLDAAAGLWGTVSFGPDFWDVLSPRQRSRGFQLLRPRPGGRGRLALPRTGGDLLFHLNSERADLNFELARRLMESFGSRVEVLEEVPAFRYLDSRDLTGFIDGTANPRWAERAEAALIGGEDPAHRGGSFVLAQRYVHDLARWGALSRSDQERAIGRTRPDSRELEGRRKAATAHISRVEIEEEGEELRIVRHSMPYGKASGEAGLFFIAYARDAAIFGKMLARMFGHAPDRLHDRLMEFTRPVTGEIFFAPSPARLKALAAG